MMEYKTNRCYMTRIRNREMTRMPGSGRKRSGFCNSILFSVMAVGAATFAGITGPGYVTVLTADNVEQNQKMTADDSLRLTGGTSGNIDDSVITPRLCRSRYQIKNELMFTVMRFALSTLGASLNICFANW